MFGYCTMQQLFGSDNAILLSHLQNTPSYELFNIALKTGAVHRCYTLWQDSNMCNAFTKKLDNDSFGKQLDAWIDDKPQIVKHI